MLEARSVVVPFRKRPEPSVLTIYQTHPGGLVSIDAIVPLSVANAMLRMMRKKTSQQKTHKRR